MRILQLNTFVDPVGGAEIYFLALADELERRGHRVTRFGLSTERAAEDERETVLRRPAYERGRLFRDPELVAAFDRTLARLSPDVVHVHNLHSLGVDLLARLAETGLPVVQTVHDYSAFCPNTWCVLPDGTLCPGGAGEKCFASDCGTNYPYDALSVLLSRLRLDLSRGFVDVALAPSAYLARMLTSHGFEDVRHLYYFIDGSRLEAPGPPPERAENELLFLGRLEREKGIDVLLEALPRVRAQAPGTSLTIVGGGGQAEALRALAAELGLSDAVRFHEKVPYEEVRHHYARATALVLPSIWVENSPLVAYECLLAGLPVIGSRIGGIPDLVLEGETGMLFTPRDPEDLAAAVLRYLRLDQAERARFSERSLARGRAFTLERNLEGVEAAYEEARARRAARAAAGRPPVDGDLAFSLDRVQAEIVRLEELYLENADYIARLEAENARLRDAPGEGSPTASEHAPERAVATPAWRRLARRLGLPKVLDR